MISHQTAAPDDHHPDTLAEEAEMPTLDQAIADHRAAEDRLIEAIKTSPREAVRRYPDLMASGYSWRVEQAARAALHSPQAFAGAA